MSSNITDIKILHAKPPKKEPWRDDEQEIIAAIDHAPFTRQHAIFVTALLAALIFDHAKPITISFVIPGMAEMWDLSTVSASYLAVAGLTGNVIGAIFWGYMGDRMGRRTALLWTVAIFSIACLCGLAVHYWNSLLACVIMGFGAGGEVPIVFALAAEYIPVKSRGRTLLFLGIIGWLGGYAMSASLAAIFRTLYDETFAWRLMWLVNIFPGILILILRSKVIPESARFLLHHGRAREARAAAEALIGPIQLSKAVPLKLRRGDEEAILLGPPPKFYSRTLTVSFFAFAAGLANYGFVTWLPTLLLKMGYTGGGSSAYLALSSLIALPALAFTIPLLSRWGARRTLIAYAFGGGLALIGLGVGATAGFLTPLFLVVVTSLIFFFITSIGGALSLYAAEIFPTGMRARRSGVVSAAGKFGGVVGPYFGGLWLTRSGSILDLQFPLAIALIVAAMALIVVGVETHGRTLEQISSQSTG